MKRTLFLFFLLFMAVNMTYAQAQKTRIIKCEYFQTDKKGYRTVSYQMEHNERFNVNILNISKPGLSGSVVLTDEALKNVVRMMNEISDLEGTYTREKLEENDDTEIKILKMKEEKDALMKEKMKKITEKMKDKEERSLECMKRNAELEENKIKNIIEKSFQTEQKVKKQLNLKNLETKNKHLYLELLRKDNMENLRRIEKKKEYDREKIILKMMDKDRKLQEIQNQKKKNIDRIKSLNREMTAKKMILLKRAREMVQSGKYRNKKDIFEKVFNNENEVSSNWNYISQKQTLDY